MYARIHITTAPTNAIWPTRVMPMRRSKAWADCLIADGDSRAPMRSSRARQPFGGAVGDADAAARAMGDATGLGAVLVGAGSSTGEERRRERMDAMGREGEPRS
jgi:hypothetical protein